MQSKKMESSKFENKIQEIRKNCVKKQRFCPKCGSLLYNPYSKDALYVKLLQNFGLTCRKCGYYLPFDPNFIEDDCFLCFYYDLLNYEKRIAFKEIYENMMNGNIRNVGEYYVEIELDKPLLKEGDYAALIDSNDHILFLGVVEVVYGNNILVRINDFSIKCKRCNEEVFLDAGKRLRVVEAEASISYDLQLLLIEELIKGEDDNLKRIYELIKGSFSFDNIKQDEISIDDEFDTTGKIKLDASKIEVLKAILNLKDGEILLVVGPPGTGKTTLIAKAAEMLAKKGEKVLIACHTNLAIDNAISLLKRDLDFTLRIGVPEKISKDVDPFTLMYKIKHKVGEELKKIDEEISNLKKELNDSLKFIKEFENEKINFNRLLFFKDKINEIKKVLIKHIKKRSNIIKEESKKLIYEAKIIGSTIIKASLQPLNEVFFDIVIIDEASQISLTLAMLGIIKAKKWILIGDHKQLLPIFKIVKKYEANVKLGIFSRLFEKYSNRTMWLTEHYRSNPKIISLANRLFYENKLIARTNDDLVINLKKFTHNFLDPKIPFVFINVDSRQEKIKKSVKNENEIKLIESIIRDIIDANYNESVGIITPYRAQRNEIKSRINYENVEIETIDSFQGKEKDLIVFSITATEPKQLNFVSNPNRLNVALTRARKKLIIIGNGNEIEKSDTILKELINYAKSLNSFYTL